MESTIYRCKDLGMALSLIALILGWYTGKPGWTTAGIGLLIVNILFPLAYKPLYLLMEKVSKVVSFVVVQAILIILFYLLVTPVALVRRALAKDTLRLKEWKQSADSVFKIRTGMISDRDIEHPY